MPSAMMSALTRAIREHRAQNAGIAMIQTVMAQRTHGIESVGRVPRSRRDAAFGRRKIGVGMSQAHANAAPRGFGNDLGRALQFGSNRHHANSSARRLPELLEQGQSRSQQIFRGMYPAPRMADETVPQDGCRAGGLAGCRSRSFAPARSCSLSIASAKRSSARRVASIGAVTVVGK